MFKDNIPQDIMLVMFGLMHCVIFIWVPQPINFLRHRFFNYCVHFFLVPAEQPHSVNLHGIMDQKDLTFSRVNCRSWLWLPHEGKTDDTYGCTEGKDENLYMYVFIMIIVNLDLASQLWFEKDYTEICTKLIVKWTVVVIVVIYKNILTLFPVVWRILVAFWNKYAKYAKHRKMALFLSHIENFPF